MIPNQTAQISNPAYPQQIVPNVDPMDLALQAQQAQTLRNIQRQQYLRMELEKVQNTLTLNQTPAPGVGDYSGVLSQQETLRWMMNR